MAPAPKQGEVGQVLGRESSPEGGILSSFKVAERSHPAVPKSFCVCAPDGSESPHSKVSATGERKALQCHRNAMHCLLRGLTLTSGVAFSGGEGLPGHQQFFAGKDAMRAGCVIDFLSSLEAPEAAEVVTGMAEQLLPGSAGKLETFCWYVELVLLELKLQGRAGAQQC